MGKIRIYNFKSLLVSEKPSKTISETSNYTDFKKITQIVRRSFNLCNLPFPAERDPVKWDNRCNHNKRLFQRFLLRLTGSLFLLVILAGCASIYQSQNASGSLESVEKNLSSTAEVEETFDYIIGSGDVLFVSVWEDKDLNTDVIVRPDGKITLPLLEEVNAAGKTLNQLKEMLTKMYSSYIISPQVMVSVRSFGGKKVILLGEVSSPGVYRPIEEIKLLELIALAGGLTEDAVSSSVIVIRGDLTNPQAIRLNLDRAMKKTDLSQNIPIQPHDIIYVPRRFIVDVNYFLRQYLTPVTTIKGVQDGFDND